MSTLIVCHACDLVHRRVVIAPRQRVRCVRCRAELYRTTAGGMDTAIAIAASALFLWMLSNVYPLVEMQVGGATRETTLLGAAAALYGQGYAPIAALVVLTTELIPLFQVAALLYVLIPLRAGRHARGEKTLWRMFTYARPWAMTEVFMLGALVAIVKLAVLAQVIAGISLFAYGALMVALSALTSATPTEQFWLWVERPPA